MINHRSTHANYNKYNFYIAHADDSRLINHAHHLDVKKRLPVFATWSTINFTSQDWGRSIK
jgi:hypothetical protein